MKQNLCIMAVGTLILGILLFNTIGFVAGFTTLGFNSTTVASASPTIMQIGYINVDLNAVVLGDGPQPNGTVTFVIDDAVTGANFLMQVQTLDDNVVNTTGGIAGINWTPFAVGTYNFTVVFNADYYYATSTSQIVQITVNKATPTITTTPGPNVTLGSGSNSRVNDSATLSGGYNATGIIIFTLFNAINTAVDNETVAVNGDGVYKTPNGFLPTTIGTYTWNVVYTGDANNNATSDIATEQVTVTAGNSSHNGSAFAGTSSPAPSASLSLTSSPAPSSSTQPIAVGGGDGSSNDAPLILGLVLGIGIPCLIVTALVIAVWALFAFLLFRIVKS